MRLTQTSLIVAAGFGAVWIAAMASCADEDPDNLLTTNATQMQTTTGMGGTSTNGGGGAGADGGDSNTGGTTSTGGQGGQGGEAEQPIHGCLSTTAMDLTGAGPTHVVGTYPGVGPICLKINDGDSVDFEHTGDGIIIQYRIVYGVLEDAVKKPRIPAGCLDAVMTNCPNWVQCENAANGGQCATRPHYCPASPFQCQNPPPTGPLNKVAATQQIDGLGVFPFYDDLINGGTPQGVIYVQ